MNGIHDVFPKKADNEEASILLNNIKKQEVQWNLEKEVLGFQFDGIKKTICLAAKKHDALLITISKWIPVANEVQQQDGIGTIGFK